MVCKPGCPCGFELPPAMNLDCEPDCGCEGLVKRHTYLQRCDWNMPEHFVDRLRFMAAIRVRKKPTVLPDWAAWVTC